MTRVVVRALALALGLAVWAGQVPAQVLDAVPRPLARAASKALPPAVPESVAEVAGARPAPRPFHVLVTGARATGQSLAPPVPPQLPLPLLVPGSAPPILPSWPGLGPSGIAPGPLAILAPLPQPAGRLAAQEQRLRHGARVSVDVGRLSRLFAATQFAPVRLTRPEVVVPDETLLAGGRFQAMARPGLRPFPRPGSVPAAGGAGDRPETGPETDPETDPGTRPETRPQARPDWPERAAVTPLAGAVAGPYAAFAAPNISPQATPVALRPPVRPAGITSAYQAARAERVRGSVCGSPEIQGQVIAPVGSGGCRVANPVRITSVGGVTLSTPSIMDCTTAQALNRWVERGAAPAVGNTGGGLASLRVIGHYSCRTRNNAPGARLSEHAKGRALDISGVVLRNGDEISVLRGWNGSRGDILRQMHRAACGIFGTVLGPNANAAHRDHFHFDTASYRTGSFCR